MASDNQNLKIHTKEQPTTASVKRRSFPVRTRLSFNDRLLRNSCLACAVLLGVLALGNLQQPWAKKAAQGVQQALTMKVDLDESLGQLSFVRKLMPESALVFFNIGSESEFTPPVQAELSHSFSEGQPWLMFASEAGAPVYAVSEGVVAAVSPLSDGSCGVLIDHGSGLESVIAGLRDVQTQSGDSISKGSTIGTAAGDIYFELRQNGTALDPTERMGL